MNNAVNIATIVLAVIGVLAFLSGLVAWLYRRGGQERAYADALDRNTKANNEVAAKLDDFKSVVLGMFHELDKRVSILEDKK